MVACAAHLVANQGEVRDIGEEAGGHFGDASATLPRLAAIDDDAPILSVERRDRFRRPGVPSRGVGLRDCHDRVVIYRHWTPPQDTPQPDSANDGTDGCAEVNVHNAD